MCLSHSCMAALLLGTWNPEKQKKSEDFFFLFLCWKLQLAVCVLHACAFILPHVDDGYVHGTSYLRGGWPILWFADLL